MEDINLSNIVLFFDNFKLKYKILNKNELIKFIKKLLIYVLKNNEISKNLKNIKDELIIIEDTKNSIWGNNSLNILGKILTSFHFMIIVIIFQ